MAIGSSKELLPPEGRVACAALNCLKELSGVDMSVSKHCITALGQATREVSAPVEHALPTAEEASRDAGISVPITMRVVIAVRKYRVCSEHHPARF